ncbi:TPA: helix-turn-helix transcriptional regulator [Stenotrophomonas maltophilia]|nr:helix-turn-helix transcriptional regulator [Stenotrophomonas maltophilia]HDS1371806.1 helix-turn-helix transcriptional regulator [Stenotrophomonas maltophilia]HDS1376402.1 helix-turn-helix transcriptional regulator [Stenotrophomonas maltophilia]HDS1381256.1 helix-turn-helix transcriptional regulator [Stenotrophomonas maltophilia]HDS1386030.1 helix-turn-helix transcriptional regulator [Stenotrophomonas maltophilia]
MPRNSTPAPSTPARPVASNAAQPLRGNVMSGDCISRPILSHLTNRWGVLVLIALLDDTQRFSQLRKRIGGVSERMLSHTLALLSQNGMVERRAHDVLPPHVDYTLTPLGREAALKVRDLADWIELNLPAITQSQAQHPAAKDCVALTARTGS